MFLQRRIPKNVEFTYSNYFWIKLLQTVLTVLATFIPTILKVGPSFAILLYFFFIYMFILHLMVIVFPVYYIYERSYLVRLEWFNVVTTSILFIALFAIVDHSTTTTAVKENFYSLIPCGIAVAAQFIIAVVKFNDVPNFSKHLTIRSPNVGRGSLPINLNLNAPRRSLSADHYVGVRGRSVSFDRSQSAQGRSLSANRNINVQEASFSANRNSNVQEASFSANRNPNVQGTPLANPSPNALGKPLSTNRNQNIQEIQFPGNRNIQERLLSARRIRRIQERPLPAPPVAEESSGECEIQISP